MSVFHRVMTIVYKSSTYLHFWNLEISKDWNKSLKLFRNSSSPTLIAIGCKINNKDQFKILGHLGTGWYCMYMFEIITAFKKGTIMWLECASIWAIWGDSACYGGPLTQGKSWIPRENFEKTQNLDFKIQFVSNSLYELI